MTGIVYHGHPLNCLACVETVRPANSDTSGYKPQTTLFAHLTNFPVDVSNIVDTSRVARLRWKIENEGFNTLKNGGYGVEHQYARKSYTALKNYFQFMQMAHLRAATAARLDVASSFPEAMEVERCWRYQ